MTRRTTPGPFLPLDVHFPDKEKIAGLSDAAFRLHVTAMLYAKRLRTDGRLAKAILPRLTASYRPKLVDELLDAKAWEIVDDKTYEVHDWADWNLLTEEASERGRAAAEARWSKRANDA